MLKLKEVLKKRSVAIITDTKYKKYRKNLPIIYDSNIKKKLPSILSNF